VFDRVEENTPYLGQPGRSTYAQMVNTSLNEVLWRSINTSITSLLPVGALLLIGSQLLGATTLRDLALALFVGMALGTYSSLFVAGPTLVWWVEREPDMAQLRRRHDVEGDGAVAPAPEAVAASRKPITTDYVRGGGKGKRRRR
jgi:preprotein translocase subunit SecF